MQPRDVAVAIRARASQLEGMSSRIYVASAKNARPLERCEEIKRARPVWLSPDRSPHERCPSARER
jgi:hypothetical protein